MLRISGAGRPAVNQGTTLDLEHRVPEVGLDRVRPPAAAALDRVSRLLAVRQYRLSTLPLSTCGHVIDEFDDAPRIAAEDAIMAARQARV